MVVPIDAPGVTVDARPAGLRLQDREGHAEIEFKDVRVPAKDVLKGEGEGFAISQARLGPGRIHHCMRAIGMAERALELMCKRAQSRVTFGKPVADNANIQDWIAEARIDIEMIRLLTLKAAWLMDTVGNKEARTEIAAIKVAAPNIALKIIDRAIQVHGGGGVTDDFPLAMALRPPAHAAPGRRPGRGAQARHRPPRAAPVPRPAAGGPVTMPRALDLHGKTAIVTGASRGIGLAAAQALAAAGANVVAHLTQAGGRRRGGRPDRRQRALASAAHAVDEDQACRCIDLALETFGSVDILVNNAGTNPAYGPMIEQDHERFAKTFDVNLWAPLLWTALATEAWMGEHGGSVINTASSAGWSTRRASGSTTPPRPR